MSKYYSMKDVARLLEIRPHRIGYAVSNGAVPQPSQRFGNTRVFTTEDVRRLADHFGVCFPDELKEASYEG